MPIIRIDDNGNDIQEVQLQKQKEEEALLLLRKNIKRKKNAKALVAASLIGLGASWLTFFLYDNNIGLLLAVLVPTVISSLNLIDD